MDKTILFTKKAGVNPNNSQGTIKNNILFTSMKAAIDPETGKLVGVGDIRAQTEKTIQTILAIVEAGGGTRKDIVKINVFLKDIKDFQAMNEVYRKYFPDELPARSLILPARLFTEDILIEMDAVAILG